VSHRSLFSSFTHISYTKTDEVQELSPAALASLSLPALSTSSAALNDTDSAATSGPKALAVQLLQDTLLDQRQRLLDRLNPQPVLAVLRAANVVSASEEERINAGSTCRDKARNLIRLVERKGPIVSLAFVAALRATQPEQDMVESAGGEDDAPSVQQGNTLSSKLKDNYRRNYEILHPISTLPRERVRFQTIYQQPKLVDSMDTGPSSTTEASSSTSVLFSVSRKL
jgi:hypothetical protein